MKKNYERVERPRRGCYSRRALNPSNHVRYEFQWGYHRTIHTVPEIRANTNDRADPEMREYGVKVRPCRNRGNLDSRNDFNNSRHTGKSWKDYTKNKRQWGPKAAIKTPDYYSPWAVRLRSMGVEQV